MFLHLISMRPSNINVAHSFIYPHLHPSSIFNRSKDEFCLQISRLLRPLIPRRTYRVKPACMRSHLSYWLHVLMNAGTKFWISLPTRALFFFFCYLWYDVPSASFYVTSVSTVFFFSLFVSVGKKENDITKLWVDVDELLMSLCIEGKSVKISTLCAVPAP